MRASKALHRVEETLRSDDAAIVVVTRPERIVVGETKRLIAEMERRGMNLGGVIANYVTPESDCPCDRSMLGHELESLEDLGRDALIIERRDEPLVRLEDLLSLVPLA